MSAHPRGVTIHNGRYTWQLTVLSRPLRSRQHFDTAEEAALDCDLVKHYLRAEYKLDLPASLDGEQFSSLAFSRRHVDLSDILSVGSSLPDCAKDFINENAAVLIAHRASAPPETTASKFRRSGMIEIPAVREWVEQLEAAELEAEAFGSINKDYFFRLLDALPDRLTDVLKPLRLALKMHDGATHHRLLARRGLLTLLVQHIELNLQYVTELTADLRAEQASVESAVSTLEQNRPPLS